MPRDRQDWFVLIATSAVLLVLFLWTGDQPPQSLGQEKKPAPGKESAKPKSADPEYPHVTLATSYQVDPAWPVRPKHAEWGHMPGVAVDARDNVWLFTRAKPPVQAYGPDGKYLMGWGDKEIGKAHHIKFDGDGNIWVADIDLHVVMQFTPQGKLLKTLGTRGRAGKDETHLNMPTDMAIAPSGDVFVSDGYGNARIVHFDKDGKFVKAWGKLGSRPGEFSIPHAIAMDSKGRLYVADRNNVRIQVFDQDGKLLDIWADVVTPWGFWMTKNDELWVCGSSPMPWRPEDEALGCPPKDQVFMRFDTTGRLRQLWTVPKAEDGKEKPGELNWVHCMALDSKGNIYAGDIIGQRAQKFVRQVGEAKRDDSGAPKVSDAPTGKLSTGTAAGQEWDGNGLNMKFCWCPPGGFKMGSPKSEKDRVNDEDEVKVTLRRGFWLGKYEVTQAEWERLMGNKPWAGKEDVKNGGQYPATHVSWEEAKKFCAELARRERAAGKLPADWTYTLPTEAQWEYACRAGTQTRFSFGDDDAKLGDYAWLDRNTWNMGEKYAHEVGKKQANAWGLHDMPGNVWEWCRDGYQKDLPGGTDPEATERTSYRVKRGGAWDYYAVYCRSAARRRNEPDFRESDLGVRVVLVSSR